MRTVAIIQARMHSTRLPGKMLLPLCGAPLIQRVIERVCRATQLQEVVLAIPERDWAAFAPVMHHGASLYTDAGDENDLVGRYLRAAEEFDADVIVRIPGDNPCVDPAYIEQAIIDWYEGYHSFVTNTTAVCQKVWIDGIGAEVFSYNRLQWLDHWLNHNALHAQEFREHPHRAFGIHLPKAQIRLDVNTAEDYAFIADIYNGLYPTHPQFDTKSLLYYLSKQEVPHAPEKRLKQKSH